MSVKAVYLHIPFCETICSYCDFAKVFYDRKLVSSYLDALRKEILSFYKGEELTSIYIGGGTPSCLSYDELEQLFDICKLFHLKEDYEFTMECNVENTTDEKLQLFYQCGVNRLSFGIQTFQDEYLTLLNRHHTEDDIVSVVRKARDIGFHNINFDLMYALPGERLEDVQQDLLRLLQLKPDHISTYSLILEEHTKLYLKHPSLISDEIDEAMYQMICDTLAKYGFLHYEISNFSLPHMESRHNLTYWDNEEYYGFGIGAAGYVDGVRYQNTKSFQHYFASCYRLQEEHLSLEDKITYTFLLGLRKIRGISLPSFYQNYSYDPIQDERVQKLIQQGLLMVKDGYLFIPLSYLYVSNEILCQLLS